MERVILLECQTYKTAQIHELWFEVRASILKVLDIRLKSGVTSETKCSVMYNGDS